MQLFSVDATIFFPKKSWKKPLQSCLEKLKSTYFPYSPELPKQKNSCSKLRLVDQLYTKLGAHLLSIAVIWIDCYCSE